MKTITSKDNPWIKRLRALGQRKYRREQQCFVAEGRRFVEEALGKRAVIEAIFIDETRLAAHQEMLAGYRGELFAVPAELLQSVLHTVHAQDMAAIVAFPKWSTPIWQDMKTIVVLDGVQDPGNLGTIIRTALAAGADALVTLKGTVDLGNEKVLRATMGALFALPIYAVEDADAFFDALRAAGVASLVAAADGEDYDGVVHWPERVALVVGNEGSGVQQVQAWDRRVRIP